MVLYKIPIIDDEITQAQVLARFLKQKGFELEKANTGMEGIKIIERKTIDLVITDFKMPDIDGIEVLKQAKEINPEIDVVVMTAFGRIENAIEAMRTGAVDYLTKPIDLDQFEMVINNALVHKQLISENRLLKEQLSDKFKSEQIFPLVKPWKRRLIFLAEQRPAKPRFSLPAKAAPAKN